MNASRNSNGTFLKGISPWNKGTSGIMKAWNKGTKGILKANSGSFKKGMKKSPLAGIKKGFKKGPMSNATKIKISLGRIGKKWTEETRAKMSLAISRGEKSPNWIADRTKLKRYGEEAKDRRSYAYTDWRKRVWGRDGFKCKMANQDCEGRIEAHHILAWREFPELRYQVNNGITLCHAHHPRERAEEKRLQAEFQQLVSVSKV